jgi:hypothetical protein
VRRLNGVGHHGRDDAEADNEYFEGKTTESQVDLAPG